jgi:TatD DNase family protein
MNVFFIDTHAHLDASQFDPDREAVIQRALEASIQVITVGTDLESSAKAVEIAKRYGLYAAVGVHPHEAKRYVHGGQLDPGVLIKLEKMVRGERVVAVGEIGLDYFKGYSPREAQHVALRAQLELAQRCSKPVILHNRDSEHDLLQIVRDYRVQGVLHSFTGDRDLAQQALDLGLYLGASGIVTFSRSEALREAMRVIPLDRLFVETDSPYLAPVPHRGRRNEPLFVRDVAAFVAQLRGIALEELAQATTTNACRLFALIL